MTRRLLAVLGGMMLFALASGGVFLWWLGAEMTAPIDAAGEPVTVDIESEAALAQAIDVLMYYGVADEPVLWRIRARQRGLKGRVAAGRYHLDLGMSPDEVLDRLVDPPDAPSGPLKFQIIPGDTIWKVRARLKQLEVSGDLLAFDRDDRRVARLKVGPKARMANAHTRLEGYLAPDTYFLDREAPSIEAAVTAATRQFKRRWAMIKKRRRASYDRLSAQFGMSDHDFLILASLVEKECASPPEASMIAGVFYNRLRKKMKLQTDPTLVYGPQTWREKPRPKHRRDATNPYNTYAHRGLPPGPICNPGPNALEAVLSPETTNAIFFVAMRDGTGRHAFSETLEQHRANIERYLK